MQLSWVNLTISCPEGVCHKFLDLRHKVPPYIYFQSWILVPEVLLEVLQRHFVAIFELSIVVTVLLYGIIGQMNKLVIQVVDVILLTTSSNVTILIEVTFQMTIDWSQHSITPEVKFSLMYEQRIINVFLNDKSSIFGQWVIRCSLYDLLDLIHVGRHIDSIPSISVLSRFDDPYILMHPVLPLDFLYLLILLSITIWCLFFRFLLWFVFNCLVLLFRAFDALFFQYFINFCLSLFQCFISLCLC